MPLTPESLPASHVHMCVYKPPTCVHSVMGTHTCESAVNGTFNTLLRKSHLLSLDLKFCSFKRCRYFVS